jgi:hypothetical protein
LALDLLPQRPDRPGGLAVTFRRLHESRDPRATRIDWAGVVTYSALFALVFALPRGNSEGWSSTLIVSLFAVSAAALVAFLAVERTAREPMLPLALFKRQCLHRCAAGGVRDLRLDVLALPLPDALPAELPRPLPAAGRPPLPPRDDHGLLVRTDHRRADPAGAGARADERRPRARRHRTPVDVRHPGRIELDDAARRLPRRRCRDWPRGANPRHLVEAASLGNLDQALGAFPPAARQAAHGAA